MDPVFAQDPHPEYAHAVAARLARMSREDREAVAGSLRRLRFRSQDDAATSPSRTARGLHSRGGESKMRRGYDFRYASPITSIPRQRSDRRIPHMAHVDVTRVVVPHSTEGQTHPRYPARTTVAAEHHDYLTEGAQTSYRTHLDYITRLVGPMSTSLGMPAMDIFDFEADHRDRNALAVLSNIGVYPERQRSLFEAAERCERVAHGGKLKVSTEHAEAWTKLAAAPNAPAWVEQAASLLQQAEESSVVKARQRKQKHDHRLVTIANVDLAEAYDRLVWADDHLGTDAAALPQFEQGRSGRVQTRFVFELPHGLDARQHRRIAEHLCHRLGEEGWMYVAAIHIPDHKNDPRNTHLHVDAYDRPCRWMYGMGTDGKPGVGCWDFEVAVKKSNGRLSYPYRQRKIGIRRPGKGQKLHDMGEAYFDALRAAYIATANDVAAETPGSTRYVVGTYRDHGIDQQQLEHLGDKVIGNEKQGLVTPVGSRNARRIFDDRLRHVRKASLAELLLLRQKARDLLRNADSEEAHLAIWQWRQIKRLAVTKQAQAAAVEIVRDMSISRAVAVIDHGKNPVRVAEAKAWIEDGDRLAELMPSKPGRLRHGDAAAEAVIVAAELLEDKVRAAVPGTSPRLTYRPRAESRPKLFDPRYRTKSRDRLIAWIDEHGDDEQALTFKDGQVVLGSRYRQSIDRLFELLIDDLLIQKHLRDIRDRRKLADDRRVARRCETTTVLEELAAVSRSGRSIIDAVAVSKNPEVLLTRSSLSSVPHDPALSAKYETPSPAPEPALTGTSALPAAQPRSGTQAVEKPSALTAAAVQLMKSNREDGWQQIISGKASITKVALAELLLLRQKARDLLQNADSEEARLAIWQWRRIKRLAVTKQAQVAAVEIVRDMSISRAVAAIGHGKNPVGVAEAKTWVEEGDRLAKLMPGKPGQLRNGDAAAEAEAEAVIVAAELLEDKVRAAVPGTSPSLTYRSRVETQPKLLDPRYHTKWRARLIAWIDEHGDDEQALTFKDGQVVLGIRYRQSIDRLFELLIDDLLIQKRLRDIRNRRKLADDHRVSRQREPATVPDETAAVSRSGRSIIDAVAISEDPQVLLTKSSLSSVLHDPALSAKDETPRPAPELVLTGPSALPVTQPQSGTEPVKKFSALRAAASQLMKSNREKGWQRIISGKAFITKTADGYSITGIPDDLRGALLHKDFAPELDRRFLSLKGDKAAKPPMSDMRQFMPLTTLILPTGVDAFANVPSGPPAAVRNAQGHGTASGLGRGPTLSRAPSLRRVPDLPFRATTVGSRDPGAADLSANGAGLVAAEPISKVRRSKLFEQAEAHAQQPSIAGAELKGPNQIQTPAPFRRPNRGR